MSTKWSTLTSFLTGKKLVLLAAQLLVLAFMLACVGWFIAGVFDYPQYAASHPGKFIPYSPPWTPEIFGLILGQYGLSIDNWLLYHLVLTILIVLVFWIVGFLIFFRKGNEWFGLYIAAIFVLFGTVSGDPATVFSGLHPELAWLLTPLVVLAWLGLFMLLFLFPNGRFTPGWTRWIGLLMLLSYALIIRDFGKDTPPSPLIALLLTMVGIGAGSQVYRYRKISNFLERQQTKWVMFALLIVFVVLVLSFQPLVFPELLNPGSSANLIALVLVNLTYFLALIPLSVAFAILRYRLWDIDLVIRRTLVYGFLTFTLGLVYFGGVTLLQSIFTTVIGTQSPLAVVLSTLLIFFLFTPLRRRLQAFIDRRFFRRRYNSEQVLRIFVERTRAQANLAEISDQLLATVTEAVEPQGIHLWLPAARFRTPAPGHRADKENS